MHQSKCSPVLKKRQHYVSLGFKNDHFVRHACAGCRLRRQQSHYLPQHNEPVSHISCGKSRDNCTGLGSCWLSPPLHCCSSTVLCFVIINSVPPFFCQLKKKKTKKWSRHLCSRLGDVPLERECDKVFWFVKVSDWGDFMQAGVKVKVLLIRTELKRPTSQFCIRLFHNARKITVN